MNILDACTSLEIPVAECTNMNLIKSQYYRLSLLHHPDKNHNSNDSTSKFSQINESYHCLVEYNSSNVESENTCASDANVSTDFDCLFTSWVTQFTTVNISNGIVAILKTIMHDYNAITQKLLDSVEKEQALEIYQFIQKHQITFRLSDEDMEKICTHMRKKFDNDETLVIHPTIDDLLHDKIYKLTVREKKYAVPSWLDESHFDAQDGHTLTVLCAPVVPENVSIDEYKNVYVQKEIPFSLAYLEKDACVQFYIGETYHITIPCSSVLLQREQIITLQNKGIMHTSGNNLLGDTNSRGNIYVHLLLSKD